MEERRSLQIDARHMVGSALRKRIPSQLVFELSKQSIINLHVPIAILRIGIITSS